MNLPENTSAAPADLPPMRVGEGWDTHALVPGRPLILGGVRVPHTHGLAGHSDADALLHAITDAVLGAAGLGDIGTHFPDTDAAFAGADSHALLQEAARRVRAAGWRIANVDCTVIAHRQRPGCGARTGERDSQNRRKARPRRPGRKHGGARRGAAGQALGAKRRQKAHA